MFGLIFTVGLMAQGSKSDFKENKNDKDMKIIIETRTVKKEPTVEISKKVKTVMIKNSKFDYSAVEFIDKNGKLKKRIKHEVISDEKENLVIFSENRKHIVETKRTIIKNDPVIESKTGFFSSDKNTIILYDEDGNKVMEKKDMDCIPVAVSEDGKRILCFRETPEDIAPGDYDRSQMAKILVLTNKGEILYEFNCGYIYNYNIHFSPNGNWIVCETPQTIMVIEIEKNKILQFPNKKIEKVGLWLDQYDKINNNGELLYTQYKKGKLFAKYLFSPMTNKFIKLIEE